MFTDHLVAKFTSNLVKIILLFLMPYPRTRDSPKKHKCSTTNYSRYSLCINYFMYPAIPKRNIHSDSYKL